MIFLVSGASQVYTRISESGTHALAFGKLYGGDNTQLRMGRNLEVFAQITSLSLGPQEAPEIRVESGDGRANGDLYLQS